jgi:spore coat protein CotH
VNPADGASFDPNYVFCVAITMAAGDFSEMSSQIRFGDSNSVALEEWFYDCDAAAPNPFTWFSADINVDGIPVSQVGIRKKGFIGSVEDEGMTKPAIKIKMDRYVEGQFLGDTERITLNNSIQDATFIKTCLSFDLFRAAGYPVPRCNMAKVVVNNNSLGVYVHVETIKKRFLLRVFGDSSGSLYEGTLADFTEGYLSGQTFGRWEIKTDDTDPLGLPVKNLYEALQAPDHELLDALEPVLNVDLFITYWAMEALINHTDGYCGMRNNFYVYFNPADNNRAVFIPWGTDQVFKEDYYGKNDDLPVELDIFFFAELPRRLSRIPQTAAKFEAELTRLLNQVWNEDTILADIDRYSAQVKTVENTYSYDSEIEALRTWIQGRRQRVEEMLAQGLPLGSAESKTCTDLPGDE